MTYLEFKQFLKETFYGDRQNTIIETYYNIFDDFEFKGNDDVETFEMLISNEKKTRKLYELYVA